MQIRSAAFGVSPQPRDCPKWEYDHHPLRTTVLPARIAEVLRDLARRQVDTRGVAADSRDVHRRIFHELTPPGCEYYAGHYRGESYRCLQFYSVQIQGDPSVGAPPNSVRWWMRELRSFVESAIRALDQNVALTRKQRLHYVVVFASRVFELFLRIHPYANGNGHAARLIVWSLFFRYGYLPKRWIDPRPPEPTYTNAIRLYRGGNKSALEQYLLSTIV